MPGRRTARALPPGDRKRRNGAPLAEGRAADCVAIGELPCIQESRPPISFRRSAFPRHGVRRRCAPAWLRSPSFLGLRLSFSWDGICAQCSQSPGSACRTSVFFRSSSCFFMVWLPARARRANCRGGAVWRPVARRRGTSSFRTTGRRPGGCRSWSIAVPMARPRASCSTTGGWPRRWWPAGQVSHRGRARCGLLPPRTRARPPWF